MQRSRGACRRAYDVQSKSMKQYPGPGNSPGLFVSGKSAQKTTP